MRNRTLRLLNSIYAARLNILLFLSFIIASSFLPNNSDVELRLLSEVKTLRSEINETSDSLEYLSCELANLRSLSAVDLLKQIYKKGSLKKELFEEIEKESQIIGTPIVLANKLNSVVIHKSLYNSLIRIECDGTLVATSILRLGRPQSLHYSGKAIDLRADDGARSFLSWIGTKRGKIWVKRNKAKVYVEDNYFSKWLKEFEKSHPELIKVNREATGPHVHIQVQ